MRFLNISFYIFLLAVFAEATSASNNFEETIPNDPRLVRSSSSPAWLAAVGKFYVRKRTTKAMVEIGKAAPWKSCSIVLVSNNRSQSSNIALSAGHCIRRWYEGGISGNRRFDIEEHKIIFQPNNGHKITDLKVVEILGYESSPGDYAILRLSRALPNRVIKPLTHTSEPVLRSLMVDDDYIKKFKPWATAAGYSTDISLGKKGKNLTYHAGCYLNGGPEARKDSKCTSYGGASGGAIVVTVDRSLSEWTDNKKLGTEYLLVGLIQGGHDGNNERSFWTPNSYYDKKLRPILKRVFGPSDVF